jgi:hypothetical protein
MILARNTKVLKIAILNWMGGLHKIGINIIENLKYEYHRNIDIDSTDYNCRIKPLIQMVKLLSHMTESRF